MESVEANDRNQFLEIHNGVADPLLYRQKPRAEPEDLSQSKSGGKHAEFFSGKVFQFGAPLENVHGEEVVTIHHKFAVFW